MRRQLAGIAASTLVAGPVLGTAVWYFGRVLTLQLDYWGTIRTSMTICALSCLLLVAARTAVRELTR